MVKKPVIALLGPTASGKTRLAMELVQKFPLEIISVDSAMIYKYMDIGTGKPTREELMGAPHALIDILDPAEVYSAALFRKDALKIIEAIHEKNKIPLLVGGTMLYFNALIKGIAQLPEKDEVIRQKLQQQCNTEGLEKLYDHLQKIDPVAASMIHPNDPQRILRALEVYEISGQPMTDLWQDQIPLSGQYVVNQIAIFPEDRHILHDAIAQRFQDMLQKGFVEEVRALQLRGDLTADMPSMRCVGYRQIWQYLQGGFDYQTMREKAVAATRQLAKRQLTWLRHWGDGLNIVNDAGNAGIFISDLMGRH